MASWTARISKIAPTKAFALLAVLAAARWASAQSIQDESRALAKAQADKTAATERAGQLESAAATASDEAVAARKRSAAVAARVQSAEADIDATESRIAIIEQLRAEQRAKLAEKQGPTVRLMAALQSLSRRPPVLALVQPGSVTDMVHVRAILSSILPVVQNRTADLRADVARGKALRGAADQALASLKNSQTTLVTKRNQLAALATERRKAADTLVGNAMAEQDRAIALGEEARDIVDLMERIDEGADRRAALATLSGPVMRPARPGDPRALPAETEVAEAAQAPYRLPVVGRVVTGLGEVSDTGVRARGLTIATRPSAQVVAPTGGRIAFAGPYRGFGNIVIIDHGRSWTTLVTSLSALDVKVGDVVEQGSPIGRAGSERPTVTVELRRGGQPVDIARLVG
jgi:murein hydrolase activator